MPQGYRPRPESVGASQEYQQWAQYQRPTGTTYGGRGGPGAGQLTAAFPPGATLETSGSLTGHLLAPGYGDQGPPKSRTAKVIIIGLIMLAVLIGIGLLTVVVAGDAVSSLFDGLIKS